MFMQFSEVYLPYIPVDFLYIFDADSMMYIVKYNNYMVIIFLRTEKISFNNRKNPEMFHGVRRIIWYPPRGGGGGPKAKHFHYYKYRRSAFVPTPAKTP